MFGPFKTGRILRERGVIGLNERNVHYVLGENKRRLIRAVDDKIATKRLANLANIPVPELYGVIGNAYEMRQLPELIQKPGGFVIKPANGAQGNGIMVVTGPLRTGWSLGSGRRVNIEDLRFHIHNIISGMYSLGGQQDSAMIEYRVQFDDRFESVSFKGVPDVRVLVVRGYPVCAMLRLPTAESDGKANLHKGGVGVGIDLLTGRTLEGMHHSSFVSRHPDTAELLSGINVPNWDDMLLICARSYDVTGLGYLGVDLVLDKVRGPLLLELNARPGISIQTANRRGLRPLLQGAVAASATSHPAEERVEIGKRIFQDTMPKVVAAIVEEHPKESESEGEQPATSPEELAAALEQEPPGTPAAPAAGKPPG